MGCCGGLGVATLVRQRESCAGLHGGISSVVTSLAYTPKQMKRVAVEYGDLAWDAGELHKAKRGFNKRQEAQEMETAVLVEKGVPMLGFASGEIFGAPPFFILF